MNQNGPNTSPVPPGDHEGTKVGPIIGIVIIILVLLLGVLYFWGQRAENAEQENIEAIESTEEDLSSLEAELNSELSDLEAELEADFTAE